MFLLKSRALTGPVRCTMTPDPTTFAQNADKNVGDTAFLNESVKGFVSLSTFPHATNGDHCRPHFRRPSCDGIIVPRTFFPCRLGITISNFKCLHERQAPRILSCSTRLCSCSPSSSSMYSPCNSSKFGSISHETSSSVPTRYLTDSTGLAQPRSPSAPSRVSHLPLEQVLQVSSLQC